MSSNNRRESRSQRRVRVHWSNREADAASAELLDISPSGLFLVPTGELPASVGKGDTVWITLSQPGGNKMLTGKVCWRGYSQTHDAIGFGVQLDPSCRELAAAAFAL